MDPTAGKNSRSPQEKRLFPGFLRSRQGTGKSGIFPCQLTGNFFSWVFRVFFLGSPKQVSFRFFSQFFHREFFFPPVFLGFFPGPTNAWFFSLFYIAVDNFGRVMWCVEGGFEWQMSFFSLEVFSAHPQRITWSVEINALWRQPPLPKPQQSPYPLPLR